LQTAVVVEVGGAVRRYDVAGRPVLNGFDADEIAPAFHGAVLAPWPNRLRDGAYRFRNADLQVALTEPARGAALHGLVCWERWNTVEVTSSSASLGIDLPPRPGYPFDLRLTVRYTLDEAGLGVVARAKNLGRSPAPYGIGFHPWLSPGDATVDTCTLRLDAQTRVVPDSRLLPVDSEAVHGKYDLRAGRLLAGIELDDAYLDPTFDDDGRSWAILNSPDGHASAIWADDSARAWQVCTGDAVTDPRYRRTGVAVEPMSCIADAFRTGDLLVELEPGETHEIRWGAVLMRPDASI
jgi:aldose 1-epimerase